MTLLQCAIKHLVYFIKMFSNSILHNIIGTDLTKAKYFSTPKKEVSEYKDNF